MKSLAEVCIAEFVELAVIICLCMNDIANHNWMYFRLACKQRFRYSVSYLSIDSYHQSNRLNAPIVLDAP